MSTTRNHLAFHFTEEQNTYLDASARIRGVTRTGLIQRMLDVITREQMVLAILDDADELGRRKVPAAPKPAARRDYPMRKRTLITDRMDHILDFGAQREKFTMRAVGGSAYQFAMDRLLREGRVVRLPLRNPRMRPGNGNPIIYALAREARLDHELLAFDATLQFQEVLHEHATTPDADGRTPLDRSIQAISEGQFN